MYFDTYGKGGFFDLLFENQFGQSFHSLDVHQWISNVATSAVVWQMRTLGNNQEQRRPGDIQIGRYDAIEFLRVPFMETSLVQGLCPP